MNTAFIRSLYFALECFGSMIAISVRPYNEYVENKRTNNILGYRYDVVLPEHGYTEMSVKIPGPKTLDIADGASIPVKFDDLRVRPYVDYHHGNALAISAMASAIHPLGEGGKQP